MALQLKAVTSLEPGLPNVDQVKKTKTKQETHRTSEIKHKYILLKYIAMDGLTLNHHSYPWPVSEITNNVKLSLNYSDPVKHSQTYKRN